MTSETWERLGRILIWVGCIIWTFYRIALHKELYAGPDISAQQQAALGASTCANILVGLVLAFGLDRMLSRT